MNGSNIVAETERVKRCVGVSQAEGGKEQSENGMGLCGRHPLTLYSDDMARWG